MIRTYILTSLLAAGLTGCAALGFTSEDPGTTEQYGATEEVPPEQESVEDAEEIAAQTFVLEGAPTATEEVTFESHGEKLSGELVFPDVDGDSPRPGVVLVHDAGPHGRDGIMRGAFGVELPVEVAVYRSLAEALASRGFVVLIYDKRTCLEGSRPWCTYPRAHIDGHVDLYGEVLVDDLSAAYRALESSPRTSDSLHIIGHGHGAELALVAAKKLKPESIVLAAPNPEPLHEMVLRQSERSIEALRSRAAAESNAETDAMVKQAEALETQYEELVAQFEKIEEGEGEAAAGLSPEAWRSLMALHDSAKEVTFEPVLIVDAGMDLDVEEEARLAHVKRWREKGAEVVTVDELTRPLVSVADDDDATVVSSQVALRIATFLVDESE